MYAGSITGAPSKFATGDGRLRDQAEFARKYLAGTGVELSSVRQTSSFRENRDNRG